ncbi:MAG: EamA family transporter, partial [Oscillospiraceae bacterium]|nr:EamA family transporter [Oscillospiraceae bacterium]
ADTMANIFDKTGPSVLKNLYLFCTFFAALLIALAFALRKRQRITATDLLCGLLIGVPNYYSTRFLLLSFESVPAVVAYPVFSVGTLIVISTAGAVFFQERLSRQKKVALLLILASLVMLNI